MTISLIVKLFGSHQMKIVGEVAFWSFGPMLTKTKQNKKKS